MRISRGLRSVAVAAVVLCFGAAAADGCGPSTDATVYNSRMIQGIVDDANPVTKTQWAYPDTGLWQPQRNTNEFVAQFPAYAAKGLRMVTVGLQGGSPTANTGGVHDEIITAFNSYGALKPPWLARLDQVLDAAKANGLIVDVSLFYFHQDQRITTDAGIVTAVDNITDWLVAGGYDNVYVEICNECNLSLYDHANLQPANVAALIARVQNRSSGTLPTSASFSGGYIPPDSVIAQADFVTLHGNGLSPSQIAGVVAAVKSRPAYQADPKPIIYNEDGTNLANMDAAIDAGASWGYYDQAGFQSLPVDWAIDTPTKQAFFDHVEDLSSP